MEKKNQISTPPPPPVMSRVAEGKSKTIHLCMYTYIRTEEEEDEYEYIIESRFVFVLFFYSDREK